MDMDIAGSMVSILMGTDQNLMPREMLPCKLHSHPLSLLHGQSKLPVLWVEAQNVMMGFDLVLSLILFELLVRLVAFAGKGGRVTVDPLQYVPRPQHGVAVFVQGDLACLLIMLENQVTFRLSVVQIFAGNMLENRHQDSPASFSICCLSDCKSARQ